MKRTITNSQLRTIVKEAVKSVPKEDLSKAEGWYRARVVNKLLKSWERYGCMEDAQNAYHRGMYEFLCFISPMLSDADMLTPQEGSPGWDVNSEWDFSKQDKEEDEMRKNRLEPSYNPYD